MSRVRLTLIVGREDEREVFVVGALNTEYLNQMPIEDGQEHIHRLKETWTGEPDAYEWREVDCLVDYEPLEAAFTRRTVIAEVSNQDDAPASDVYYRLDPATGRRTGDTARPDA